MQLKILVPAKVFADIGQVSSIVADTRDGSFGILPQRLDCVAALVPGILAYRCGSSTVYLAVDEGVLVKTGANVLVSVRHAIQGADLDSLREAVEREFLTLDAQARETQLAVAKLESGLLARFAELQRAA